MRQCSSLPIQGLYYFELTGDPTHSVADHSRLHMKHTLTCTGRVLPQRAESKEHEQQPSDPQTHYTTVPVFCTTKQDHRVDKLVQSGENPPPSSSAQSSTSSTSSQHSFCLMDSLPDLEIHT
eukprot:scpid100143/ scgid7875/ 